MNIRLFNEIFINKIVDKRKIIYLESIFIIVIFLIIIFSDNLYDYYNNYGELQEEDKISTIVNSKDLEMISSKREIKINNKIYSYEVDSINEDNYINDGKIYKIVIIKINHFQSIKNSYIEYQIIKEKETILNYFIKTMKGG